jgi:hypothetical protein
MVVCLLKISANRDPRSVAPTTNLDRDEHLRNSRVVPLRYARLLHHRSECATTASTNAGVA